jgi:two-component system, NarL family, response regulator DegU
MNIFLPSLAQENTKPVPSVVFAMPDLMIAEILSEWQFDCNFYPSATIENGIYFDSKIKDLMPDYIFIDSELPDFDLLKFIEHLSEYNNSVKLIIYASQYKPEHIHIFLDLANSHIKGFIHKGCGIQELEDCFKEVFSGRKYVSSCLGKYLEAIEQNQRAKHQQYDLALLTPREREVWDCIAQGKTERQIADELFISEGTIKTHKQRIKVKLELPEDQKIAYLAIQSRMN